MWHDVFPGIIQTPVILRVVAAGCPELFEARKPKDFAIISEIAGRVGIRQRL